MKKGPGTGPKMMEFQRHKIRMGGREEIDANLGSFEGHAEATQLRVCKRGKATKAMVPHAHETAEPSNLPATNAP